MSQANWTEPDWVVARRVIGALLVRDVRTRSGRSAFGFIKAILIPFLHLAVVVLVYTALGRLTPIGTDTVTFLALGVIPFILFMYPARMLMISLAENKPLLYFPTITNSSIIIARAVAETLAASAVCGILVISLIGSGHEFTPHDEAELLFACLSAVALGVAIGWLNAVIASVMPLWNYGFNVMLSGFYAASGLMFLPDQLPEVVRKILVYDPLLHCVEWVRTAYYDQYVSYSLDCNYLFWFILCTLTLALGLERLLRRVILAR
jgi:capsular polysaccharide transport system permease protein